MNFGRFTKFEHLINSATSASGGGSESGGVNSTSDIDDINALIDGSAPTSATEAEAISNVESNIVTEAASISVSLNSKFGSAPGSNRLDIIGDFIDAQTVPPDSLSDIDDINLLVDGSTPTSANEGAAITNVESNITTEAQGISDGLSALLGSAPAGIRLDQIHSFVDSATVPSGLTELTDWTTRFADGPFSEGDTAVWTATGAVYRFSAALRGGSGDWVRSEVYDSSFVAFAHVDGDEANSTEILANGWDSVNTTGAGAVNYNQSGKFEMDLTGTGAADRSYLQKAIASSTSTTAWACGLYTMDTFPLVGTVYARLWTFFDGTYSARFQYAYSHNKVSWSNDALALLNTQFGQDSDGQFASNTDEKHLAFSLAPITSGSPGLVRIWIDHALEPYWVGERDQGTATGANVIQVGVFEWSNGGTDAITLQVRDWSCGGIL